MIVGISGGDIGQGFVSGMVSSAVSSIVQISGSSLLGGGEWDFYADKDLQTMLFGSVGGGVSAELAGGNFWQGAAIGLTVSALNHVAHKMSEPFPKPNSSKIDKRYGVEDKTWEKKSGRWTITTKKEILQWDSKKGEIEVYNKA